MKILICTGYTNHERGNFTDWANKTTQNKFEYAEKHGYGFLSERNYEGYDRPISWYKINKILKVLNEYDWIVWMDADSLITNYNIKIEDIINKQFERQKTVFLSPENLPIECSLPELKETNYIISQDNYSPCMGIFFIRNCEWSRNFFEKIYNQISFMNDGIWENRAQDYLLYHNPNLMENIKFVPKKILNSFTLDWTSGDFIIHWPATEYERKKRYTDEYLEKVIK
jgi:mannan polymerase II complex MNN10 subunit